MTNRATVRRRRVLSAVMAIAAGGVLATVIAGSAQVGSVVLEHDTGIPFIFVGSTADGGGALAAEHGFAAPIEVTASASVGGFVLYTATDPSFEPPDGEDGDVFFLDDGTVVNVEITALGPQVAMKLGGVELDHVGASVRLGTAPALHQHPEWQLTLPEGETDCQPISFKLTTTSATYTESESYTAYVTNDETTCAIPTATPTPVPTATPAPGAVCGDADGSGVVTVSDGVNVLRAAAGLASTCATAAVCDVDGSGAVSVSDGVNVLRAAAGLSAGLTCPDL